MTCEYDYVKGFLTPIRVHTVVISAQHEEDMDLESMREQLMEHVVRAVIPDNYLDCNTIYHLQVSQLDVFMACGDFQIEIPLLLKKCISSHSTCTTRGFK